MTDLETKIFLEKLKTNPFSSKSEDEYCKKCNKELTRSYEKRYQLCDKCQSPDDVDLEGTDDSLHRKKRTFEYIE